MEDLPLDRIAALVPEFAVKDLPWAEHWLYCDNNNIIIIIIIIIYFIII